MGFKNLNYNQTVGAYNRKTKGKSKEFKQGLIMALKVVTTKNKKATQYLNNKMKSLI